MSTRRGKNFSHNAQIGLKINSLKVVCEEKRSDWIPLKPTQFVLNLLLLLSQESLDLCDIVYVHGCVDPEVRHIRRTLVEDAQFETDAPPGIVAVGAPAETEIGSDGIELYIAGDGNKIG